MKYILIWIYIFYSALMQLTMIFYNFRMVDFANAEFDLCSDITYRRSGSNLELLAEDRKKRKRKVFAIAIVNSDCEHFTFNSEDEKYTILFILIGPNSFQTINTIQITFLFFGEKLEFKWQSDMISPSW